MTQDFYKEKLIESGLSADYRPSWYYRGQSDHYDELCLGDIKENSKQTYLAVIDDLKKAGARSCYLGLHRVGLLVKY